MRLIPDRVLGAMTIWQEARGEGPDGQLAVGNVIRHRIAARYQSDGTVAGTVAKRAQFSGWTPGDPNHRPSLTLDDADLTVRACLDAWDRSETMDLVPGALHYLNVPLVLATAGILPRWAASPRDPFRVDPTKVVAEIGGHTFLRILRGGPS